MTFTIKSRATPDPITVQADIWKEDGAFVVFYNDGLQVYAVKAADVINITGADKA